MIRAGNILAIDAVGRQLTHFQQGRAGIEQAFDALARQQLAPRGVAFAALLVPTQRRLGHLGAQLLCQRTVVRGAGLNLRIVRVEGGCKDKSAHRRVSTGGV